MKTPLQTLVSSCRPLGAAAVLMFAAASAVAQSAGTPGGSPGGSASGSPGGIVRSVDPSGRVIYSDRPVANTRETGRIERAKPPAQSDVQAAQQRRQSEAQQNATLDARLRQREQQFLQAEDELRAARTALADAQRRHSDGQQGGAGDFVANAGGGVRPSQQFLERQHQLESDLQRAQERVAEAQRRLNAVK